MTAGDEESVRSQLSRLMTRDNITVVDMFEAWDKDTDGMLRKKEWLVAMRRMLGDDTAWRGTSIGEDGDDEDGGMRQVGGRPLRALFVRMITAHYYCYVTLCALRFGRRSDRACTLEPIAP